MKPMKQIISENQDFYNGVAVGLAAGVFAAALLFTRSRVVPIYVKPDGMGVIYE